MSRDKRFDSVLKFLIDAGPPAWSDVLCRHAGLPTGRKATVVESDLATVVAQADKIIRLEGDAESFLHVEAQGSRDDKLPDRTLVYNTLHGMKVGGPVDSIVLLLRKEADAPNLTGLLQKVNEVGKVYLRFEYAVIRVWELSSEELLSAGLSVAPLALVTDDAAPRLDEIALRVKQQIDVLPSATDADGMRVVCRLILGLRYRPDTFDRLFPMVKSMKESLAYQEIVAEGEAIGKLQGRLETLRETILEGGEERFGSNRNASDVLNKIEDSERLVRMRRRLLKAATWDDLLNTP